MKVEQKLAELGIELPPPPKPAASYVNCVRTGNLVYLSGTGATDANGQTPTGKVGADVSTAEAAQQARTVGINILAILKEELGDLDRVRRIVKLLGMVNCTPEFQDHPKVINGCSELFADVFGQENGIGARSAVGMSSLPGNIAVEIEAVFEIA